MGVEEAPPPLGRNGTHDTLSGTVLRECTVPGFILGAIVVAEALPLVTDDIPSGTMLGVCAVPDFTSGIVISEGLGVAEGMSTVGIVSAVG